MTALFTCGCSGYQVNSDLPVVPGRYIQRHRTLTESWLGFAAVSSFQYECPAAHLSTKRLSWVILFCRAMLTRRIQYASAVLVCCLRNAVESSVRLVKVSKCYKIFSAIIFNTKLFLLDFEDEVRRTFSGTMSIKNLDEKIL
jgi:hypothetical protein